MGATDSFVAILRDIRDVKYPEIVSKHAETLSAAAAAEISATNAANSANTATTKANEAAQSASSAGTSATNAASSANTATAKASAADASATTAADWAIKTSGPVTGSEYSAKYHANSAANSASTATTKAAEAAGSASNAQAALNTLTNQVTLAQTAATNAGSAKDLANTYKDLASQWADKLTGEVVAGRYSARFWADTAASYATAVVYTAAGVFTFPDLVIDSQGFGYRCIAKDVNNNFVSISGIEPSSDPTKWVRVQGGVTTASALPFIPDGDIAATNVQAAIEEVRDDTDAKLGLKANSADVYPKTQTYSKTEVDTLLGDVVSSPLITTSAPSGVSSSTMTLNGSVESFGITDMDALTVGFEYKRSVDATWTATSPVAKSTLGAFSASISGLSTLTSYDIRAVAYDALNPTLVSYGATLTQSTSANDIPSNPTNTGSFPSTLNKSSTTQFTFSGAADTDGTVTHYLVEQISSANLTVTTAEVAAGSAHTFNVGSISADEAVSFVVKAKDNAGAYSAGVTVNVTLKNYVGIGTAGAMDFGVAPSFEAFAVLGLAEMTGTTTPGHENWGNYIHTNGSIMVHVPKFYYRIGNASAPQYATYGLNSVEIAGADVYADEASANAAGFALHRAFIDGGVVKGGFFIDKYLNSKKVGDANVAVSVKNGNPIGLTTSTTYSTPSSTMPGCTGILADAVVLSRARGAGFNTASVFMYGALALLSIAHGQMATSTTACAWYDAARTTNFPKGCNNNALADVNDTSVTWTGNGVNAAVGLTGSASNFAKSTHNGQNSGIADLNGLFYEPALGLTNIGTSATSTTQITTNTIYVLKQSAALASLTAGWDGATDAWANTTNLSMRYDAITSPITVSAGAAEYWGSGTNQVFDPALSGVGRDLCGVLPKNDAADDATGTNLCGNDYMYHYNLQNMFPLFGGYWGSAANAGVLCRYLSNGRSGDLSSASFRVAAYVS